MNSRGFIVGSIACAALAAGLGGPTRANSLADLAQEARAQEARTQEARTQGDNLFGSVEVSRPSFRMLPQWGRVLNQTSPKEWASEDGGDGVKRCATPVFQSWCELLAKAAPLGRMERLDAVNRFFNRLPYREDRDAYGQREYWATPKEFMTRSGDCEDFSIAKYFALRELGFSQDEMRIVVLKDEIRGIGHAVLALYVDNDILILDNRSNLIASHSRYKFYTPLYSMNETTHWFHVQGTV